MSSVRSICAGLGAALGLSLGLAGGAGAGDLLVTAAKPDQLFVIEAATRSVRTDIILPAPRARFHHFDIAGSADGA